MSFAARKDTRSSSSHYERYITKIKYNSKSSITKKNIHYKKFGVPGASKKCISHSPGKADFHSVSPSDRTIVYVGKCRSELNRMLRVTLE